MEGRERAQIERGERGAQRRRRGVQCEQRHDLRAGQRAEKRPGQGAINTRHREDRHTHPPRRRRDQPKAPVFDFPLLRVDAR
jgi:hypothetical protein